MDRYFAIVEPVEAQDSGRHILVRIYDSNLSISKPVHVFRGASADRILGALSEHQIYEKLSPGLIDDLLGEISGVSCCRQQGVQYHQNPVCSPDWKYTG